MNGLDVATKEALLDAVRRAADDDAARCVVLTGSGRAFCVGQDLKEHIEVLESADSEPLFNTVEEHYNPIVTALLTMHKPVVAAVNGVAAGAGASLAFACDFRILKESAGFNLAFAGHRAVLRHRVVVDAAAARRPGQGDGAALLPAHDRLRRVPRSSGLATTVVPEEEFDAEVATLAGRLADGPTLAYGAIRRSVEHSAGHDFAESLAFESSMMTLTGDTEDHRNAVSSFVKKEKPVFTGE